MASTRFMTTVINIKDTPYNWKSNPQYVYIGRTGRGFFGAWGNPFRLDHEEDREYVLDMYKKWLYAQPTAYLDKMQEKLWGKILVCFCKPKACHGDIILEYLQGSRE